MIVTTRMKATLGLPGPATEWRVNASSGLFEYRPKGSSEVWASATGSDFSAIVAGLVGNTLTVTPTGGASDTLPNHLSYLMPRGIWTDAAAPVIDVGLFLTAPGPAVKAKHVARSSHPGDHAGAIHATHGIELRPTGSGKNGPSSSDVGMTVSAIKVNWGSTTVTPPSGEIDGLYIVGRTSGPDSAGGDSNSDMSGILVDVQNRGPVGFANCFEGSVSNIDRTTFQFTRALGVQLGIVNTETDLNTSYGLTLTAKQGVNTTGLLIQTQNPGTWTAYAEFATNGTRHFYFTTTTLDAPFIAGTFKSVKFQPQASAPAGAARGTVYFDETLSKLRVFDGSTWINLH